MVHNLHFLCWKASYKANPSSHKVVQFPQLTWCVPLWDVKFREILGQYCFYRSQCLVASVVNSFGGVCVISIFICTPHPYGRQFFWSGRHISESVIFISFDPFGIGILTYIGCSVQFLSNWSVGISSLALNYDTWKPVVFQQFTTCRNQCLGEWVKVPVQNCNDPVWCFLLQALLWPCLEKYRVSRNAQPPRILLTRTNCYYAIW